jgi:tight adherence protein B
VSVATVVLLVAAGAGVAAGLRSTLLARQSRLRLPVVGGSPRSTSTPGEAAGVDHGATTRLVAGVLGQRTVAEIAAAGALAAALVMGVVAALGPVALVVGSTAGIAAPLALRSRRKGQRGRLRGTQLPSALDRLATALRAGSPVPTAMVEAGASLPAPVGPELVALGHEADAGRAIADVLDGWARRHDDASTRLAATALALSTTVGGAAGRAVDGVAATLRERLDLADERRSLAAQARLSALVLAIAPVGFAVLLGAVDGSTADFLLGTPAGWLCLCLGLALDAGGAWWMAQLTRGPDA